MSYTRVIPRDLFNEGNLLKCYGHLWILLERFAPKDVSLEHTGEAFEIDQNENDGSLTIINIDLTIRDKHYELFRPLNSREPWPLYLQATSIGVEIPVFNEEGNFSDEMIELLEI